MTNNKVFSYLFFVFALFAIVSCDIAVDMEEEMEVELPSAALSIYTGNLTYNGSDGTNIVEPAGTAEITKSGSTYTIAFSDGVPSLSNLVFEENNGAYATIGNSSSASGIVIEGDNIDIAVTKSGSNWAFVGSK